jgi:hypothetical protein
VLGELRRPEVHFVEQLEADPARFRQSDGGHGESDFRQPGDGTAPNRRPQPVFDAGFLSF